jgi:hypothetical protein
MKKYMLLIILGTIIFAGCLMAQKSNIPLEDRWKTVEELAGKQLPESALKEVEIIFTQAQQEKNSVEVIKAMIYKMRFLLEKNPDEAPLLIKDFEAFIEKSSDPSEKALLHSMTAELYLQYYQKDQWTINNRTELKGFVPEDMKEWTKNIYFDKISQHLTASLENPVLLQQTDALKFKELLNEGIDSRTMQPTLFDFLAYRKINILQQLSEITTIKNPLKDCRLFEIPEFIGLQPDTVYQQSIENPILETHRQLISFRLKEKCICAIIYTDLHYLSYLKQHTELENADSLYLSALNQLKKQYNDNEAVVEVLGEIANYYVSNSTKNTAYKKMAYAICTEGVNRFPAYIRIGLLENLLQKITQKTLSISNNQIVKPASDLKITITSANIDSLKLRIYKVNATAVDYYKYTQSNRSNKNGYQNRTLIETRTIKLNNDLDFENTKTELSIKTPDYGIYEFSLEKTDNKGKMEWVSGRFTVTDLGYIVRTNEPDIISEYVLDRNAGKPQTEINVEKYTNKWRSGSGYELQNPIQKKTNNKGLVEFLNGNNSNNVFFFEKGKDKYFSSASNTYYYEQNSVENKEVKLTLFTDRSLYRPGQTVYFKGIAYYSNETKQETADRGTEFEVTLLDANGQQVSVKKFKTNEYGSFAGEFVLPESGLNGQFSIKSGNYNQYFWVEEYKRPTFEVKIEKPKAEISFNEKVIVTGTVKGYAGYTIGDAKINYRVVRRTHRYCWWFSEPDKQVASGTSTSKTDGTFEVSFVPVKTNSNQKNFYNDQFYTFTIYVDATDPKGETQKGEQTISVGDKSLFILTDLAQKVDKKQPLNVEIWTETLNGEKLNSILKYNLYKLRSTDIYAEKLDNQTVIPQSEKVLSGNFDTNDKKLHLEVSNLISGRYKLVLTTSDVHGKEVKYEKTIVIYSFDDKRPPVKSYVWLLTPKTDCEIGEKAQIQFGTSTKNSFVLYEIMQGNTVLESRWMPFSDEIKTFDIPFKKSYGAGVNVVFTFMKDEQLFTRQIQLRHKTQIKKLTPTLSVFRDKLLPGEKAEWTISVPESASNRKQAELMVDMYDASLDILHPHSWDEFSIFRETIKYSPQWSINDFNRSSDYVRFDYYPPMNVNQFDYDQLNWFGLNLGYQNVRIRGMASRVGGISIADVKMAVTQENSVLNEVVVKGYGVEKKTLMTGAISISDAHQDENADENKEISQPQTPVQNRTNFNETAFFYPQLRTDSAGNVKFTFTAPESLTRWNVKMLAHTKDLYFGQGEAQVVTQKDLMVQMNLPRFVRRSDKLILSANVMNLTDKAQTATVQFEMIDPATEKSILLKDTSSKTVLLAAKETKAVEWEITEFSPYELVTCKVVANAGKFSDGEQKYLPVLPDKILVTESLPLTIRGNQTRTFNFESLLKNVSKVDTKNLVVEFSSNPAWYAVQALPILSTPENDNALDYFTAYYANSLAAFIANSNPKIASTFDRWKKAGGSREALFSNLEKNKELKNMLLEETPWVMAAKDETGQKRQIALLFDLNMQKNQAQQYLDNLISLQLPSGGFAWFKGMSENRYITQEIMLNLARLNRMTGKSEVGNQQSMVNSALSYLDREIARDFENLKKYNKNYDKEMSIDNMQLFYLHLRSEYPNIPIDKSALEALKFYTAQSEKYWTNLTLYGKAMMAVVAYRNGKTDIANDILMSLKENALKTDEFGMYWAKNTAGYFWNARPIAVQSAIIEAFSEVSKNTADVDEMKIWLLKQKQTQRWDSPMATVDAIYALLNQGSDWLENNGSVKIKVGNSLLQPADKEAGTDYFKETIPVADIRPDMGKVTVEKTNAGFGWGAMYWQYYQDLDNISGQSGPLKITKKLFVEKMTAKEKTLLPIEQTSLKKGDKVITRLVISTDRNLEFVELKDLRASCFEPVNQLSGYEWKEGVGYYQTTKDASTQFFFSYLQKGTYVFQYELWANTAGEYTSGIASIQCQYAPEFVGHTGGERIVVL